MSRHDIVSSALQPAPTIRLCGGKVSITDGPFAETKEQLGGVLLAELRALDEACASAAFPSR